jgi:adenine phosphoribosyltransferase
VTIQDDLVRAFRWIDGHADVWRWLADGELFSKIVVAIVEPFRDVGVTKVAALEARGFLLAGDVATDLGAGVVGVRKQGAVLPGPRSEALTDADYRGRRLTVAMETGLLIERDHVLLVDDWIETGSQALAARALITGAGATFAGLGVIVRDGTPKDVQARLQPVHCLIDVEALGPSDALPSTP